MSQAHTDPGKKCRLAELVQYTCNIDTIDEGVPRLHCYPILRIFRMCPNRPAVEITKLVNFDPATGKVEIPPEASQVLPKGKPWRDVARYEQKLDGQSGPETKVSGLP
ncbi:hypothetical protein GLOTRDRAFT_78441 [Gloeophyllum trabeum ATCC 11539]|uniref:Uncharacterized protein n=1 Tax=Gloeophyllum trabeum (strain ATCC 11539 / FP-39264 / Madison 617) TaxID=670483 RepID=S7RGV6_GLOTA|nr:uncharacterized protein GLOTRDRAFT_78441 [Gloeophyllum trabeum ATCC 11539]EPQ53445.1 hypothetical protein GLOTRDRAFT_78441 [Gloeophyllum trabeum ATCC 11539]